MRHLQKDIDNAVQELKGFFTCMAIDCRGRGWSYYLDDNAPESFADLKANTNKQCIPIATSGSDTSIYGFEANSNFRFWHDVTHLELDKSFSEDGERTVIGRHKEQAIEYGLSSLALTILMIDTLGQVEYYFENKRFVNNQETFIHTYLNQGKRCAMALRG